MNLKTLITLALAIAATAFAVQSCTTPEETRFAETYLDLPSDPYTYTSSGDNNLPTLGRVLFYDRQLSINNSVSCSSCHKQALAFADNTALSKGFDNRLTTRNSMPIQNIGGFFFTGNGFDNFADSLTFIDGGFFFGSQTLFWDGRENNLNTMVLRPIINHVEMGIDDLDKLAAKLQNVPYYKDLFLKAFGTEEVSTDRISAALSSFIMSISAQNTKLDKVARGEAQFTALENKGQQLFVDTYECNACHQVGNPHGYVLAGTFANIGLDPAYDDNGVEHVTGNSRDAGKFKIPSLRNVLLTGPYMHDGRFGTLEEVFEHYSSGIEDHPNLDFRLRDRSGSPLALNISSQDKQAIVAFLGTLTDYDMLADPKFSNPFKTK
jgi:cytochrome c peroxidase